MGTEARMSCQGQLLYSLIIWVGNAIASGDNWVPFIRKFAFEVALGAH